MRIALTMRVTGAADYHEPRDAISHDWIDWLAAHGNVPVLVPNRLSNLDGYLAAMQADALILTGGNDVVATLDRPDATATVRDATEIALLVEARRSGIPVLGICRGLHMVNRYFGGTIEPDLSAGRVSHVAATHEVMLAPGFSDLANNSLVSTNSYHTQGVTLARLASGLHAFATCADDELIEGLHHVSEPILAVQWHPERPTPRPDFDDALIDRLFQDGAFWR